MIANARYKAAEDCDPRPPCCEALRLGAESMVGVVFKVDTGRARVDKVKCGYCGAVHEYRSLRIVEGPEGAANGWMHVGCIDIKEGS